jgi:hypothetical protein
MHRNSIPSERTLTGTIARLARPALLGFALAGFAAAAPAASAADCVNGYRTLGNQVIVQCDEVPGASASTAQFPGRDPLFAEPATTGSVSAARSGRMVVDSIGDCQAGSYRIMEKEDGDVIIAC